MKKSQEIILIEARKLVSDLIFKVLTEKICVREAIKLFPPDINDPSIQAAWHALVYYGSDDEMRKNPDYLQEQNDYLEMIGFLLRDGSSLPQNIIDGYSKYHDMALIPNSKSFLGWIKRLFRFTI